MRSNSKDAIRTCSRRLIINVRNEGVPCLHRLTGKETSPNVRGWRQGLHLDDTDYKVMSEKGANIAFCPTSNLFPESGLFNLDKAHQYNFPAGLGTDVGAGASLSILQTMDEAYKVTQMRKAFTDKPDDVQSVTPMENLYLATLGGTTVLSLQDKIGSLTPGKEADIVVFDPLAGQVLAGRNEGSKTIEETLFGIEMLGDDRTVAHTYVMGNKMK